MEERFNAASHGVGIFLSVAALLLLMETAIGQKDWLRCIGGGIYGITLILLYLASTLYHSFQNERRKHYCRIFDHSAIYLLIAGTYTPFTLITLKGLTGWVMCGVVWGIAAMGIIYQCFFVNRFRLLGTASYIGMGWLVLFVIEPLVERLPWAGVQWLLAGGALYMAGVFFYLYRQIPYHHGIWHLFVLGGSIAHFIAIYTYVIG